VKLWLAHGDIQAATRWTTTLEQRFGSHVPFRFEDEVTHIAQARVLIAQNKPDEAIELLSRLEERARSAGRIGRFIEILILEALARREMGDSARAILALTNCLALAEHEGYLRIFLDEGQPMRLLLAQWQAHAEPGSLSDYVARLLSAFDVEPLAVPALPEESPPTNGRSASSEQMLIEPLSQRELEVLHLMALGRTNREIARQLIVAPGTVKAHTASIYRKLNVANRTEAATRARQLGLLP
jgi:LuxR family maltose regulon positive regulatory protein